MKDLDYFLKKEDEYNASYNPYEHFIFDEGMSDDDNDPLDFLLRKPFHKYSDGSECYKEETSKFGLTDAERTILSMFYGEMSVYFRDDNYIGMDIPELVKEMMKVLDSVVGKAPATKSKILYRFCKPHDKTDMKVDDIINFKHNLTCTADDWGSKENTYTIRPLPSNQTRAHDLFKIRGTNKEKQVDFLRETSFKVTKIDNLIDNNGDPYKKIYMDEIKKNE